MAKRKGVASVLAALDEGFFLLKTGIETGDWARVAMAYEVLTGDPITPAETPNRAEDTLQAMATYLTDYFRNAPIHTPASIQSATEVIPSDSKDAQEIAESRRLSALMSPKEHRDPFQLVEVVCSRCNKTCSVHPELRPARLESSEETSRFICDRCFGRRGS